jgi:hypothetical protein
MRFPPTLAAFLVCLPIVAPSLFGQGNAEDDGLLRFDNAVSAFYDSNINGNSSEESDIELAYKPTLNFTRRSGLLGIDASVGGGFGWFLDNSEYDYQDFYSSFGIMYPNDASIPYKLTLGGGYNSTSTLDRFVGGRVASDNANLSARFRYNVNERWGFSLNSFWREITYDSARSTDQTTWGAGFDFVYIYSEKLEIFAGYGYSETSAINDYQDHTFRIKAEGELTPKLTGILGLGYQIRESSAFGNTGDPYVNLDLAWAVNERIEVAANSGIGYDTTSTGSSGTTTKLGMVAAMALSASLTGSLGVSYNESEYSDFGLDRSDEYLSYQAALAWQLGASAALTGSVTFEDADSTRDQLVYDRLRAGLNLRMSF